VNDWQGRGLRAEAIEVRSQTSINDLLIMSYQIVLGDEG